MTDEEMLAKTWRSVEIEQDCSYGFTKEKAIALYTGWSSVKEYCGILHDKDYKQDGETKREDHVHLLLFFNCPVATRNILGRCKSIGLPDDCIKFNQLEKIKSKSGAVNYLTHRDEVNEHPWKHVYDTSELFTNMDFEEVASKAHSSKVFQISDIRKKEIIDKISNGDICEYNKHKFMTDYEMIELDSVIKKAFELRALRLAKESREMEVIFISGDSGVGKDVFAVEWCKKMGLDYFRTNNNDKFPFDDYRGEPAIIWSDARDTTFKINELFNLLDNHFQSKQKARFHDRLLSCKVMLITSVQPLKKWYDWELHNDSNPHKEPVKQLYRRIGTYVKMDADFVRLGILNATEDGYSFLSKMPNTYTFKDNKIKTQEEQKAKIKSMFGMMGAFCEDMEKAIDKIPDSSFKPIGEEEIPFKGKSDSSPFES